MKVGKYLPMGPEVLFEEVRQEKTAGGIYIPSADFVLEDNKEFWGTKTIVYDGSKSKLGSYKVVSVGHAVHPSIVVGDAIIIRTGVTPETIEFEEGTFFSVNQAYIIGIEKA
jgi:co-chaperonin GroES (HSP10)